MKEIQTKEIIIGRKPFHAYLTHVARMLHAYGSIRLRARGVHIPKAIDVAMIASRRPKIGGRVVRTAVGTDAHDGAYGASGKRRGVSTVTIDMALDGKTDDMA